MLKKNMQLIKILSLLKPHIRYFIIAILCMVMVAISEGLIPKIIKDLLDKGFNGEYKQQVWQLPSLILVIAVFRSIGQFGSQYYTNFISQKIAHTLRCGMFSKITSANMLSMQKYQSASLINTVIFEVLQILSALSGVLITLVRDSITLVVLLGYLLWINWQLALVVGIILPPIAFLVNKIKKRLKKLNKLHHEFTNDSAYQVEQVFKNIKIVKAYNAQNYENNKFQQLSKHLQNFSMKIAIAGGLNQPITQMLASIALAIVIGVAIFQSGQKGVTVGEFTSFIMAMLLLISPLKRLSDVSQPLQRSLHASEHIFEILDLSPEFITEKLNLLNIENIQNINSDANDMHNMNNTSMSISINNLQVKYGEAIAIQNLCIDIPATKHTAIVGSSGSGKSTLLQVLLGFVMPSSGEVLINICQGNYKNIINITDININQLREYIAYIGQEVVLFNRSIAENIAYGKDIQDIDMNKLNLAIKDAYLSDFINTLPQGIYTVIGDSGNKLSGGQRQRLSIARAFYKNAPILFLDEATSALDGQSEEQVQLALSKLEQGKTIVSIAHRLHTIVQADNIIVLHQGVLVEQGKHNQLLANNSYYANLYTNMLN